MNRAHHRLPRPVGLPPRYRRASATTFDEVKPWKPCAIPLPAGVRVEFGSTPAFGEKLEGRIGIGKAAGLHLRHAALPARQPFRVPMVVMA